MFEKNKKFVLFIKRVIDIIVSGLALILLCPIMICVALLVFTKMGSPILFKQVRPGQKGRPFVLYKFRSMNIPRENQNSVKYDSERLTKIGKFLRSTSLDELPQLYNILKGDMSLVGPRPLLMQYIDRYTPEQYKRHDVKPGITGWAQVNGRNAITWEQKFALDVWYVDHWTLMLDIKIFLLTILTVVRREGISSQTQITMSEFMGSNGEKQG